MWAEKQAKDLMKSFPPETSRKPLNHRPHTRWAEGVGREEDQGLGPQSPDGYGGKLPLGWKSGVNVQASGQGQSEWILPLPVSPRAEGGPCRPGLLTQHSPSGGLCEGSTAQPRRAGVCWPRVLQTSSNGSCQKEGD